MKNFDFCSPTRIIFGKSQEEKIGKITAEIAKKVLLVYGKNSIKKSGLYEKIIESFKKFNVEFYELSNVVPNPRTELVRKGIEICKEQKIEMLVAAGGGSVIDTAKSIAMGVYSPHDIWDIYKNKIQINKALDVGVILTIPAAGSESSESAVLTDEHDKLKYGYSNSLLRPKFAIINPELFFTLPKSEIANGVSDMMSHIFERYITKEPNNDLTNELCEGALRTIMKNALLLVENQKNYEAWCEIGFSGMFAHNGILGMGRVEDWGTHAIEHEISAIYDIPHGLGLSILTPRWMEYVYKEKTEIFERFAKYVMQIESSDNKEKMIILSINKLKEFFKKLNMPATLKEIGIKYEDLELMSKKCTKITPELFDNKEYPIGRFKSLKWTDVFNIYKMSYC